MISLQKHRGIACLLAGILVFAAGGTAAIQQGSELTSQEASRCGFEPVFANKTFVGYRLMTSRQRTPLNYIFPTAATIDELKVSMMLSRTCNDVTMNYAERVDPPCNDGLDLINLHSKDAAFLGAVGARVNGRPDKCVQSLIGHLTAPVTFQKYADLLDATTSRNKKTAADFREYWKSHSSGGQAAP